MGVIANQTRQQAHEQIVLHGQMGSLAGNPSEEYLLALREYAYKWIADIDEALHVLYMEAELAADAAHDDAVETSTSCGCDLCEQNGLPADPHH